MKLIKPLRIAISGKSGCGNTSLGRVLSQMLEIKQINYTFRNLAVELGMPFDELRLKAETDEQYDKLVDTKQVELAKAESCVLGSRLSIWMLEEADLKIYLDIDKNERARRIVLREGGDLSEKSLEMEARDTLDHNRYIRLYNIDNENFKFANIVITDKSWSTQYIANYILEQIDPSYFES